MKAESIMPDPPYPRQFVDPADDLATWDQIEPYYRKLLDRDLGSVVELEAWLIDGSELMACIDEVRTDRYVRMTCQTDDPQREKAYLDFVENIEPQWKQMCQLVDIKYTECPAAGELPRPRYHVFDRDVRSQVELFREENVKLQTEESKLEQRFQKLCGAMTVHYDGKEQTLQQLAVYGERTDRHQRQEVWELATKRRLADVDTLEDIFDELFKLRHQMARNADLPEYRAYAFKAKQRFDYGPQDCLDFHDAIEGAVVPVMRAMHKRRASALKLDTLRPWDLAVDEQGRPPLKPCETIDELCAKCSRVFHRVDPELGDRFDAMNKEGLLDLDSRKGKAPGGYQATYSESRRPFIFMNAVGLQRDVRTLIHEGGHAFHAYESRHDPLFHYRSAPIEFAEVASMGMEMLAYEFFDEFYEGSDLIRAKRAQLEGIVNLLPWVATIDAFQHWMYTHPDHTRQARQDTWLSLHARFGGLEDYRGHEKALAYSWQRQLHLFEVPFYYVEYGIAQLGALQVWQNARRDRKKTVADYRKALALGGGCPLPELFAAAGARFDFTLETLAPLMEAVADELASLDG
ncbi:MAG: M3 family oligoendopeptidase [Planctomycetes bacterium]|nr:M3 family oligoendopeptidase [Planctomycetota bacterium]